MRSSLDLLGRRLPELAPDLAAIAEGVERGDPATIHRARNVAERALRELCTDEGIEHGSVDVMLEALLEKQAIPYSIATSIRTLFDPESSLVGDHARALVGFLEWRVGSRSRIVAVRPKPRRRRRLPIVLVAAIVAVGAAIALVMLRSTPAEPIAALPKAPMLKIAGATFDMGSSNAEIEAARAQCRDVDHRGNCDADNEELAQEQFRSVTISAFEIDQHEVTIADYLTWLNQHPPSPIPTLPNVRYEAGTFSPFPDRDQLPIAGVTWNEARAYCAAVGKRLPTEAEWELAARGTQRRTFPWGTALPQCARVVFARQDGLACVLAEGAGDAAPVGSAEGDVTPEGVHDLGGNVGEWTADTSGDRPTCSGPCIDPKIEGGPTRVIRGGAWNEAGAATRGAGRATWDPDQPRTNLGFRCVLTAASPSS